MRKLILTNFQAPGDVLMLSAAIRDLHLSYPGEFLTDVRSPFPELWENNPDITPLDEQSPSVEVIPCHYPLIHRSNVLPFHFLHGFIDFLNKRLKISIRISSFKAALYLTESEKEIPEFIPGFDPGKKSYWLITNGGKYDFTCKWWSNERFQEVIDYFKGKIKFIHIGELQNHHPDLSDVIDLRGKTSLRQLIRLMYHADGALSPVSFPMHLAAAVETKNERYPNRACVVVTGGREPVQWEAYPHHQFLHTAGALSCCNQGGCWKSRTKALGDGSIHDKPENLCLQVVNELPKCMDLVQSRDVIRAIELYYTGGALQYSYEK